IKAIKAFAFLHDHGEPTRTDLAILEHILWTSKAKTEREVVRKVIYEMTRNTDLVWACTLYNEAETVHQATDELLYHAASTVPYDDDARATYDETLAQAWRNEEGLTAIYEELDTLGQRTSSLGGGTTIRTLMNQVTIFRKHLVKLRGVEEPFIGV